MKALMLEVYMAMMKNHCFSQTQVPLTVAWMVYAKVVLKVQVDWKIILGNQANNLPPYRLDRFASTNPSTCLETHLPHITILPILTRRPQVPPQSTPITSPFSFQLVPPILIVPKIITLNIFCTQDLNLMMNV